MTSAPVAEPNHLVKVPAHSLLPRLAYRPLRVFEQIGRQSGGALVRLHMGLIRPYLVAHPDQLQQIFLDRDTFRREGMIWEEARRLEGDGIAGDGQAWQRSRRILQPLFSVRSLDSLQAPTASAVAEGLDSLAARCQDGRPVGLLAEMTRIMHRVLVRVFFSDRISLADADRLGAAIDTALRSMGVRTLLPFVSHAVPLPGDRAFARALRTIDGIVYPLIRAYRGSDDARSRPGSDLVSLFVNAVDEQGVPLDDKRIRDDLVAMFVGGTETTAVSLVWLLMLLDRHPQVATRLVDEATNVVGGDPPGPEHLPGLVYTRMALQETLRLYPAAFVIPRRVARPAMVAGTAVAPGAFVLLSPYLVHRLPAFWDDPYEFRPERFAPDQQWRRHRFAYIPFGVGDHQCLGKSFFMLEGQLAVAGLLSRFRPRLTRTASMEPRLSIVLQPRGRPEAVFHPRRKR